MNKKNNEKQEKREEKHPVSIEEITEKQMINYLIELTDTVFWVAIQKYNRLRDQTVSSTLISVDPFKEPTSMARTQGIRIGLYDMESGVINYKEERRKETEEERKKQANLQKGK